MVRPARETLVMLDCVIVGGGPAGLAVAHTLKQEGLGVAVLERGAIAHNIAQYPPYMRYFSTNGNLEIDGFPLGITEEKPSRREYLKYLTDFAHFHKLEVRPYAEVTRLVRQGDGTFQLEISRLGHPVAPVAARTVVLAVGAWDDVRRLDVPGADLPKVRVHFTEPHDYIGQRVLVVGGRNSAVEAALQLWRAGAIVSLSYRRTEFTGVGLKYWLRPDIENRLKNGEITGYLGSQVLAIGLDSVTLRQGDGSEVVVGNDFVLPMLGYDPPVGFLRACGVELEPESNRPIHDAQTLETTTPGLFVAGVITAGNVSGKVFIENSRHHGELIAPRVRALVG
jgi:thioredoxin reductase (NADPH)